MRQERVTFAAKVTHRSILADGSNRYAHPPYQISRGQAKLLRKPDSDPRRGTIAKYCARMLEDFVVGDEVDIELAGLVLRRGVPGQNSGQKIRFSL